MVEVDAICGAGKRTHVMAFGERLPN